jgi:hypothetical protein
LLGPCSSIPQCGPAPGLPDFSWCNAPKHEKMYQMQKNINKNQRNVQIFHSKALRNLPKWDFWYENIPSGNPVLLQNGNELEKTEIIYAAKNILFIFTNVSHHFSKRGGRSRFFGPHSIERFVNFLLIKNF